MTSARRPAWLVDELARWRRDGLERRRCVITSRSPGRLTVGRREYVDFSSNDYLGLAADPRVAHSVRQTLASCAWGAGASPLVTGFHPLHELLEQELLDFERAEAVLLLNGGYVANVSAIAAFAGQGDVIYSERRNHASLIDGCRLSRASVKIYRQERLDELERALATDVGRRRRFLVTDSVFSMDGDVAPLRDLCDLADRHDLVLYVDEAHATGVLGPNGRGLAEELGVEHRIPIRLGTLGKGLGGFGAFLVTTREWKEWFLHRARGYVFSTSLPPAVAAGALAALRLSRSEPFRRKRVRRLADRLRDELVEDGWDMGVSVTPILPLLVGEPQATIALASDLRRNGLWVAPIRPPTVPIGTSRIRLSIGAGHADSDLSALLSVLRKHSKGEFARIRSRA